MQNVCACHNMYCIVNKNTVLLTKKFNNMVLSVLAVFRFMASKFLCILLHCCKGPIVLSSRLCRPVRLSVPIGGGRQHLFPNSSVVTSIEQGGDHLTPDHVFRFVDHVDNMGYLVYPLEQDFMYANLALTNIVPFLSKQMVQKIAWIHQIPIRSRWNLPKDDLVKLFDGHNRINCSLYISVLESRLSPSLKKREASAKLFAALTKEEKSKQKWKKKAREAVTSTAEPAFPPPPLMKELGETIIWQWCEESKLSSLEESGCVLSSYVKTCDKRPRVPDTLW